MIGPGLGQSGPVATGVLVIVVVSQTSMVLPEVLET
jgi:hypothetical protein